MSRPASSASGVLPGSHRHSVCEQDADGRFDQGNKNKQFTATYNNLQQKPLKIVVTVF